MMDKQEELGEWEDLSEIAPLATAYSIIKGVGNNYRLMPNIFRDNDLLPGKTKHRYCIDYWNKMGGPYRFNGGEYKTQEDLDREREALTPQITVEIKGPLKWTQEEALQYLEEKAESDAKDRKKAKQRKRYLKKLRTLDEIYYADIKKREQRMPTRELQREFRKYQAKYDEDAMMAEEAEIWDKLKREKQRRANRQEDA